MPKGYENVSSLILSIEIASVCFPSRWIGANTLTQEGCWHVYSPLRAPLEVLEEPSAASWQRLFVSAAALRDPKPLAHP